MNYFITGGTGFIGTFLIEELLHKPRSKVYVLVRKGSKHKVDALRQRFGVTEQRIIAVNGNIEKKNLGISKKMLAEIKTKQFNHFFHLAAVYNLGVDEAAQAKANIDGTKNALALCKEIGCPSFQYMSSIAVAGLYKGVFTESMFDEATGLEHPYFATKHAAEALVRQETTLDCKIYRPSMVVGHSKTGEMDKIDGPYYLFKFIQRLRYWMPQWMPMLGIEGGTMNMVPVDFVAQSMVHIAHNKHEKERCFHLVDPKPLHFGELANVFCDAAHAPKMAMRIDRKMLHFIAPFLQKGLTSLRPVRQFKKSVLQTFEVPEAALDLINYPTKFDCVNTVAALDGSGIEVPKVVDYAPAVWDYWERNLDPDLFKDTSLRGVIQGKVAVVTGASSGIGREVALKLAEAGAITVLVARNLDKLQETLTEIQFLGGTAHLYQCDVSDLQQCDQFIDSVLADLGHIHVLVNNAGRSIRRPINQAYDRFHDYERTMQLNYFGALRLIMKALPSMEQNREGHIINISSIGVLTNAPRFSAYVASKAALDAFSRCAASEYSDRGIHFTTINMPLVRTPMISPTKIYQHVPALAPEEAADLVVEAIRHKPKRIATRLGIGVNILYYVAPKLTEIIMNTGFRMFPDSSARKTNDPDAPNAGEISSEQVAFSYIMRGLHW